MICFPLDNTEYQADALGAWCGSRTRGVFAADAHYPVTANGDMTVTLGPGIAWLKADTYWGVCLLEVNPTILAIATADGSLTRYAAVCLQLDKNANTAGVVLKYGPYGTNPDLSSLPAPMQNSPDYDEIYVAAIRIRAGATSILATDVTDLRLNETYCGIMRDGVTGIPTQTLYDDYESWLAQIKDDWETWWNDQQDRDGYLTAAGQNPSLETNDKTVLGAINELIDVIQSGGTVKSVNTIAPDVGGNVTIAGSDVAYVPGSVSVSGMLANLESAVGALMPVSGSNANGSYTKFPDGTAIISKVIGTGIFIGNPWGALYASSEIQLGPLPMPLVSIPAVSVTCNLGPGLSAWIVSGVRPTTVSLGSVYAVSAVGSNTTAAYFSVIAVGRWK